MDENVLNITDLHVTADSKKIIKGVDLTIKKGEVHVLFGPNGSGKSTLLSAIMKLPGYSNTQGNILIHGTDTAGLTTDAIANLGVGMSFQHPPKIKGITLGRFLTSINRSDDLDHAIKTLNMESFLNRELNVGFSGGELKRAEILKLYAQNPDLLLVDEPESGVDIENIAVISNMLKLMLQKDYPSERSALIITHTGHILNTIHADVGHVFMDGKIVCTGNPIDIMEDIKLHGFSGCVQCIKSARKSDENV